MIRNYFRIAGRYLLHNRFSSAINIGGLAIGMAVAILIGLWICDELSFNNVHMRHDRIAAVLQNQKLSGGIQTWRGQAMQLAPVLNKDYKNYFRYVVRQGGGGNQLVSYGEKQVRFAGSYMDPQVIDLLSLHMLQGDNSSLRDIHSMIISEEMANGLFGAEDPIGREVKVDNDYLVKVTGVYAGLPDNSSFAGIDFISPFELMIKVRHLEDLGWGNSWFRTYVLLNDDADLDKASTAIQDVKWRYSPGDRRFRPRLFLQPMNRWRLYSDYEGGLPAGGRIKFVRLYAIIGIFVLILACINFMNLSTARSEKRAKEVGIRKAIGSVRRQLIGQFLSESLVVAFVAFVVAIALAQILLPFFNEVANKKMTIPAASPAFWFLGLCFIAITGMLAGSYPAFYLSSFRAVKVLKGTFRAGPLASLPRKVLVVLQFTVSVTLIIGTIAVFHQIQYARDRPVGFNRDGLITVPKQSVDFTPELATLRLMLQQTGQVDDIAGSESTPANTYNNNMGFQWKGKDPSLQESFVTNGITPEFGKVTGWQITDGRDFRPGYATDSNAFIINETAAKYMNLGHPVGEQVKWSDNGTFTIIGVVKDMVSQSPYDQAEPMIFYLSSSLGFSHLNVIDIRLRPGKSMTGALGAIANVFRKIDPQDPFEYKFADDEIAKKFGDEERIGRLARFFTLLAIVISCLGLLGLSAFVAEQRKQEIGVRKVLGASTFTLWQLLSREFVGLVGLSLLIGGPLSWWLMHDWLNNFRYRAGLSWWIFAGAAFATIGITLATVSWQAIRAALANPVRSLRSE
ncbi:MAG TPA: ABC transporter permease [Puia sp.]|nr:ABC transporter permease [Puia sp.]